MGLHRFLSKPIGRADHRHTAQYHFAGPDDRNPHCIDAPVVTLLRVGDIFPLDLGHFLEKYLRTAGGMYTVVLGGTLWTTYERTHGPKVATRIELEALIRGSCDHDDSLKDRPR